MRAIAQRIEIRHEHVAQFDVLPMIAPLPFHTTTLHFAVSTPNHVIQEEMVGAVPWYDDVVRSPIRLVDGHWELPRVPGLGIEVDAAACDAHPFEQEVMRARNAVLSDRTVVDW